MGCEFICDGCGEVEKAVFYKTNPGQWFKPEHWYQRGDADGIQDACSRKCVEKIAEKTKKTSVVLPL